MKTGFSKKGNTVELAISYYGPLQPAGLKWLYSQLQENISGRTFTYGGGLALHKE